eukprot:8141200-Karenia_brevis.AAC.1
MPVACQRGGRPARAVARAHGPLDSDSSEDDVADPEPVALPVADAAVDDEDVEVCADALSENPDEEGYDDDELSGLSEGDGGSTDEDVYVPT